MLDVCRHFHHWEVKRFIGILALHKLNVFHWHLTDDQGWRIEIRRYRSDPTGSVRAGRLSATIGPLPSIRTNRSGGYYTQDEIREVVAYAAERGYYGDSQSRCPSCVAALAAYPWLGCTEVLMKCDADVGRERGRSVHRQRVDARIPEGCADREFSELFPSEYIHIGGDESPRKRWKSCPFCQDVSVGRGCGTRPNCKVIWSPDRGMAP